jgi:transcriptional regulator with XRE-family HTH domain
MPLSQEQIDPELLLNLRKRVRLTQPKFAERLMVHWTTVSRWERGVSRPSPIHLRQMRNLWGFSIGEFRDYEGKRYDKRYAAATRNGERRVTSPRPKVRRKLLLVTEGL